MDGLRHVGVEGSTLPPGPCDNAMALFAVTAEHRPLNGQADADGRLHVRMLCFQVSVPAYLRGRVVAICTSDDLPIAAVLRRRLREDFGW